MASNSAANVATGFSAQTIVGLAVDAVAAPDQANTLLEDGTALLLEDGSSLLLET
jgi:hypothetical protein